MKYRSQIAAITALFAVAITPLSAADKEPPAPMDVFQTVMAPAGAQRVLLAVSPLPRIYVPLGLLPIPDINNPTFGMEDGRIAWISEEHVDTLAISYAEKQPEAWPGVHTDYAGQWIVLKIRRYAAGDPWLEGKIQMTQLLNLETKLSILARNPCACDVCADAAKLARWGLAEVAPSGAALLDLPQGTPEFIVAEQKFRADETARLQDVYDLIGRGQCLMVPPPAPATLTPIPDLPDPEEWRERIEYYRKHSMGPRIEKMRNPRIPGSYIIK